MNPVFCPSVLDFCRLTPFSMCDRKLNRKVEQREPCLQRLFCAFLGSGLPMEDLTGFFFTILIKTGVV